MQRSPTLLLSVPAGASAAARPFPAEGDQKLVELSMELERAMERVRAVEGYLTHRIPADAEESEELWRLIARHFGETPSAPGFIDSV